MKTKIVGSMTLQEDLDALGVKGLDEAAMARIALGQPLSEQGKPPKDEPDPEGDEPEGEDGEDEGDGEDYDEAVHDAFDGPFVTPALFDRIEALPFEDLDEDQVEQVIAGLKAKRVPRNIEGIEERAAEVARQLVAEATAKRVRRARAHSMSKKASYQCPPGMRKDPKDPSGKRCIRAMQAVGGAGKLSKIKRKSRKWAKSGAGQKSAKISARWAGRRPDSQTSEFAVELEHLLSESVERQEDVRAEILGRIDSIVDLLVQEFDDVAVLAVFNEAVEPIAASYEAGRLDEDVMNADAFLAEIRPVMAIISKSLDRLERSDLGNA